MLEGWGPVKDGSTVILLGYYNRNRSTAVDIPIGPDNRIEPGGPDYGQPTHFEPSQQFGVFAIKVPANFGTSKLTWTLKANGQEAKVTFWLNPPYWVDFFKHAATRNEPPLVRAAADGPAVTGPPIGFVQTLAGAVGTPVPLRLWVSDVAGPREGPDAELAEMRRQTPPRRRSRGDRRRQHLRRPGASARHRRPRATCSCTGTGTGPRTGHLRADACALPSTAAIPSRWWRRPPPRRSRPPASTCCARR